MPARKFLFFMFLLAVLAACLGAWVERQVHPPLPPPPPVQVRTASDPIDRYGITTTTFGAIDTVMTPRQSLAEVLAGAGVPSARVDSLLQQVAAFIHPDSLRPGMVYRRYRPRFGRQPTRFVVLDPDPLRYLVLDLARVQVRQVSREVQVAQRIVSGSVRTSLRQAFVDKGLDPRMAESLAEVFQWKIDFSRVRRGDQFKVIYERRYVEGKPYGPDSILAARFRHRGREYYGFRFVQDSVAHYYDEEGRALRSAFLMAPVEVVHISSPYNLTRLHPVLHEVRAHLGTDYAAPLGTPIQATGDGVVEEAGYRGGNGNYVRIRHDGTYTTAYLHMVRIAPGIQPGVSVAQGTVIGYVGMTGLATGPHVCYRFWKRGVQVDPLRQRFPSAEPIQEVHQVPFFTLRDDLVHKLDGWRDLPFAPAYASLLQ
jgi:murein DD-endopeptidase MepM/ murein hydrolase activator NlpD